MRRILETWARDWRRLRAWRRPLDELEIKIVGRQNHAEPGKGGAASTGRCSVIRRRVVVRAGSDLPDALATILHEYAHAAVPADVGHGPAWAERFADAVREVTGIAIVPDGKRVEVDRAATEAVRVWWKASGNEFGAELLGVRRVR